MQVTHKYHADVVRLSGQKMIKILHGESALEFMSDENHKRAKNFPPLVVFALGYFEITLAELMTIGVLGTSEW